MPEINFDKFCLDWAERLASSVDNGQLLDAPTPTGTLDALISPENTRNNTIRIRYDQADGKTHKVYLSYVQPDCVEDLGEDECADICDVEGDPIEWQEIEVTADLCSSTQPKFISHDEMKRWCENGDEVRDAQILRDMNVLRQKINRKLIAEYAAGAGGILNGNGATGTQYSFLYDDGTIPQADPTGWMKMKQDLLDLGFNGKPIIVGDGNIYTYAQLQDIACCNAYGQDLSKMGPFDFYYDNQINPILSGPSNQNPFLAWVPGSNVFISRPEYKGQFRYVSNTMIRDTIVDPITGLVYDFEAQFSECKPIGWKWHLKLHYGLFQLPLDLYKDCDDGIHNRNKVNYNFLFDAIKRTDA